ncbi:MAG: rRNA maturation RNase YbeY [Ignavibacteriae bacterium]|nr:rRNA maturation RNase YbeY [Ignavibacteriota bacterium]MCB9209849.1 rRNA maturation RNase YbeY [Ignavibacteriales bacterium]
MNFKVESVSINFLTEQQIIPINNEYLGHNFSTDIITFNYSGENYTLDGEIFISLDDALFNAKKYGNDLKNEILRLIIHGFLHLVGYDDKEKNDRTKMKNIENRLVNKYLNHLT